MRDCCKRRNIFLDFFQECIGCESPKIRSHQDSLQGISVLCLCGFQYHLMVNVVASSCRFWFLIHLFTKIISIFWMLSCSLLLFKNEMITSTAVCTRVWSWSGQSATIYLLFKIVRMPMSMYCSNSKYVIAYNVPHVRTKDWSVWTAMRKQLLYAIEDDSSPCEVTANQAKGTMRCFSFVELLPDEFQSSNSNWRGHMRGTAFFHGQKGATPPPISFLLIHLGG